MDEMELMGVCARLKQMHLPSKEYEEQLDQLAKEWLEKHNELPEWW